MRSAPARKTRASFLFFKKKKSGSTKGTKKIINRSTKKYFSQMAVGGVVFLSSFVFLGGYLVYKYLNQTFASASTPSSYSISGEKVVTLSFIEAESINSDPVILKSLKYIIFDKNNDKVNVFDVPLTLQVDVAGRFGQEEVSKIFALGALNSQTPLEDGIVAVDNTLSKIFGYAVDRYVLVDSEYAEILLESITGHGLSEVLNLQTASDLKQATVSDLSIREYQSLASFSSKIPGDNVSSYSVAQEDINDTEKIDNQVSGINFDGDISKEGLSVSVLNGTDISGIASLGSRFISNAGGRVVAVSNASGKYDKSLIVSDMKDSDTVNYLSRVLGVETLISKSAAENYHENVIDRSDITVIIGFDTAESLY